MNEFDERINQHLKENKISVFVYDYTHLDEIKIKDKEESLFYKSSKIIQDLVLSCRNNKCFKDYDELYKILYSCGEFLSNNNKEYLDKILEYCFIKNKSNNNIVGRIKILLDDYSYYREALKYYAVIPGHPDKGNKDDLRDYIIKDYMRFFVLGSFSKDTRKFNIIANEYMEVFCDELFKDKSDINKMNLETLFSIYKFMEDNIKKYSYDQEYATKFKSVYTEKLL